MRARQGDVKGGVASWRMAIALNAYAAEPYAEWRDWLAAAGCFSEAVSKHERALRLAPLSEALRVKLQFERKRLHDNPEGAPSICRLLNSPN